MNRKIVIAVVVVTGAGVVNGWVNQKPITPVLIGSYVFLFVLAIMDTFGGGLSTLSGALAMLAMTYVLLTEIPWQDIIGLVTGNFIGGVPDPHAGKPQPCTAQDLNGNVQNGTTGTCLPGYCNIPGVGCVPALTINGKAA